MATFLLDTNVVIDVLRNRPAVRAFLANTLADGGLLACCPTIVTETYAGMRPKEEAATDQFLASLNYFSITPAAARLAGLLKRDFARKGITLHIGDATIAAVAIHYQANLVTGNVKDFPMQALRVVSPYPSGSTSRSSRTGTRYPVRKNVPEPA